ncbi:N-acetylmuramoyl-L-alanine amidase [Actinomadura barringtoniae]|uniref:N-acetylmuramoyl-L-alanine amidase n=2 Tax=Actinomadura barringtoniae TaxID=1427535 RepID=A0A939PAK0_9ACTN|nr:N-acetylmuramoyl-L-alanine amidase [Actinomadura barringtoniae]
MAAGGLALCLVTLTACGGDGKSSANQNGEGAQPPVATGGGTTPAGATGKPDGQSKGDGDSGSGSGSLKGKVIAIDPGHNGGNSEHPSAIAKQVNVGNGHKECDTTGTSTNSGYNESAFTWDVSKRLVKLLKAQGAKVVLTRDSDTGVGPCVTERAGIGNRAHADAALSIHADGAPASGHGFHVIEPLPVKGFNTKIVPASVKLGHALRDAFKAGTGIPYSNYIGSKALDQRDDLGGLNLSTVPKVFVECGNMRNSGDAAKFTNPADRQRIAEAFAKGFEAYFA